jgi:Rps23 Pro-64 3,4-dihydroxylase Tpa1-like proline 4-hydroxylase
VTAILYLNSVPTWKERELERKKGGCLRCYLGAKAGDETGTSATEVLDVVPVGGRLVIFDSQIVLHEVMPMDPEEGNARRMAMTLWVEDYKK